MVQEIFLISPIFQEYILPFVLVFAVVFAILQKSNILGEDKKQVNSLVGLVMGLLSVSFSYSREIIGKLMPVLAIMVVVLLCFMLVFALSKSDKEIKLPTGGIIFIVILTITTLAIALLVITGVWNNFVSYLGTDSGKKIIANVILIGAIAGAMFTVWRMKGS